MGRLQFGVYARKLRIKAGLSQGDVADKLNLKSGQLVSNWERGTCYPPLESMGKLADMYNVSLKSFFDQFATHHKEDNWKKISKTEAG